MPKTIMSDPATTTATTEEKVPDASANKPASTEAEPEKPKTEAAAVTNAEQDSEDEEEEDEAKVLEESPCGRWQKRNIVVSQRNVPGIDTAFLAMDTEEGVEVIWNEVELSGKRNSKKTQEQLKRVFDNLVNLDHVNIVKFHSYWLDQTTDRPRIIFITEYMSAGTLKQFLSRTKSPVFKIRQWKRRCQQILSALSYLHACSPPIVHGNLNCNTIFIQHNGLVKIGSVAPDIIHHHVKSYRASMREYDYHAPEYLVGDAVTSAADIYSFGMCALEMIVNFGETGEGILVLNKDNIQTALDKVEIELQKKKWEEFPFAPVKDFIRLCLAPDPSQRPTARELLFHPIVFEVPQLRVLCSHVLVENNELNKHVLPIHNISEDITSGSIMVKSDPDKVIADLIRADPANNKSFTVAQINVMEIEKLVEDVKCGLWPLTMYRAKQPPPPVAPPLLPTQKPYERRFNASDFLSDVSEASDDDLGSQARSPSNERAPPAAVEASEDIDYPVEPRKLTPLRAKFFRNEDKELVVMLTWRFDDNIVRQVYSEVLPGETGVVLAENLAQQQLINQIDVEVMATFLDEAKQRYNAQNEASQVRKGDWVPFAVPTQNQDVTVARAVAAEVEEQRQLQINNKKARRKSSDAEIPPLPLPAKTTEGLSAAIAAAAGMPRLRGIGARSAGSGPRHSKGTASLKKDIQDATALGTPEHRQLQQDLAASMAPTAPRAQAARDGLRNPSNLSGGSVKRKKQPAKPAPPKRN